MQLNVITKDLLKAVKTAAKAIGKKSHYPIMQNVLIETSANDTLTVTGTDLDLTIVVDLECQVEAPGSITVNAKQLIKLLSTATAKTSLLQVIDGKLAIGGLRLDTLPADDYPDMTFIVDPETALRLPGISFKAMMDRCLFAVATDDHSSIIDGVSFKADQGCLELASTDASRLSHIKAQYGNNHELNVIVPGAALKVIAQVMAKEPTVAIAKTDKRDVLAFIDGNVVVFTKLIQGEYPRYKEMFPSEAKYSVGFYRQELIDTLKSFKAMDHDNVILSFSDTQDIMWVQDNTLDDNHCASLSVECNNYEMPDTLEVCVDVNFLLQVLEATSSKIVHLEAAGPLKPLIFTEDDKPANLVWRHLLMPIQTKKQREEIERKKKAMYR